MAAAIGSTSSNLVDNFHGILRKKNIEIVGISQVNMFALDRRNYKLRLFALNSKSIRLSSDLYLDGRGINGSLTLGEPPHIGLKKGGMVDDEERPLHACMLGRFVEGRFVYRQAFVIRSYEIGPDKTATMETLMNLLQVRLNYFSFPLIFIHRRGVLHHRDYVYLQETALNHVTSSGLAGNGFGATREMSQRKLIWVVTRVHVQVDKYSSWYGYYFSYM